MNLYKKINELKFMQRTCPTKVSLRRCRFQTADNNMCLVFPCCYNLLLNEHIAHKQELRERKSKSFCMNSYLANEKE